MSKFWLGISSYLSSKGDSILAFLLATTVSVGVDQYFRYHDDSRSEFRRVETSFLSDTNAFDILVGHYVRAMADSNVADGDAKRAILDNIVKQSASIAAFRRELPAKDQKILDDYQAALDRMNDVLSFSTDVLHMKSFWETASRIVTLRTDLEAQLHPPQSPTG
jgi:hypothetical protein